MKYGDKKVATTGGDSACALMLALIAAEVRRIAFRAHEHSESLLENSAVNSMISYIIKEVTGNRMLENLYLQEPKSKETVRISVDYLLVTYGFTSAKRLGHE